MNEEIIQILNEIRLELKQTNERIGNLESDIFMIKENIVEIQEDIVEIKEDTEITRSATNSLVEWAEVTGGFPIKKAE